MKLQHPVPDDHLKHIGDITVSFALLEGVLRSVAHTLLGTRQRLGQIVTAEISFKALLALTISLYIQQRGEDKNFEPLKKLMRRAAGIEIKRNNITHSEWVAGKDVSSVSRIKTTAKGKQGMRFQFESVTSDQLEELAKDIKVLAYDVQDFYIRL
jgi:hypothetical protein